MRFLLALYFDWDFHYPNKIIFSRTVSANASSIFLRSYLINTFGFGPVVGTVQKNALVWFRRNPSPNGKPYQFFYKPNPNKKEKNEIDKFTKSFQSFPDRGSYEEVEAANDPESEGYAPVCLGALKVVDLAKFLRAMASVKFQDHALIVPESIQRLESIAGDKRNNSEPLGLGGGVGIEQFLHLSKRPYRLLFTKNIRPEDLPADYPVSIREPDLNKARPGEIHVNLSEGVDIFLASHVHNGSKGVVRLGWLDDGTPVAIRAIYNSQFADRDNKLTMSDYEDEFTYDRRGVGPRVHGLFTDEFGRVSIVMDIVPGEMEGKAAEFITLETLKDLGTINDRLSLIKPELSMPYDVTPFVTSAGRMLLIDAQGISQTKKDEYNVIYQQMIRFFLEITNDKVQEEYLHYLFKENVSLLRSLRGSVNSSITSYIAQHGLESQKSVDLLSKIDAVLDGAMFGEDKGGIDLTAARMKVQTKVMDSRFRGNDSEGIKFHIDAAMFARLGDASGYVPVIISEKPLNDLKAFLDGPSPLST